MSEWDAIGFVISSKYRIAVFTVLTEGPATTTEIAEAEELSPSHVSRALGRLRSRSLVELIVPEEQRKNRQYDLTDKGEQTWSTINTAGLTSDT
ncbi:winged helix-turn-helix domain-containing protein [Halobellus inordinatus]|uniref:winged helix-turn-helix domain-containing protein n=1 Tax=Halobellus inordinatus TaxID=1126236 RepID=UPI0021088A86|nr:winged helix-turn-helix domain-containing protein [Halobellus inordinatus]